MDLKVDIFPWTSRDPNLKSLQRWTDQQGIFSYSTDAKMDLHVLMLCNTMRMSITVSFYSLVACRDSSVNNTEPSRLKQHKQEKNY